MHKKYQGTHRASSHKPRFPDRRKPKLKAQQKLPALWVKFMTPNVTKPPDKVPVPSKEECHENQHLLQSYLTTRYRSIWAGSNSQKYEIAASFDGMDDRSENRAETPPLTSSINNISTEFESSKNYLTPIIASEELTVAELKNESTQAASPKVNCFTALEEPKLNQGTIPEELEIPEFKDTPGTKDHRVVPPELAKKFKPYWKQSFLTPVHPEEKLGVASQPQNIRQCVGIDIYEARGIVKGFKVETMQEFHHYFTQQRIQGQIGQVETMLRKVVFSAEKVQKLVQLCEALDDALYHLNEVKQQPCPKPRSQSICVLPSHKTLMQELVVPEPSIVEEISAQINESPSSKSKSSAPPRDLDVDIPIPEAQSAEEQLAQNYVLNCAKHGILPQNRLLNDIDEESVCLGSKNLGQSTCVALAESLHCLDLQLLNMSQNAMQRKGGLALARTFADANFTSLTEINLSNNQIGNEAMGLILCNLKLSTSLKDLNIAGNKLNDGVARELNQFLSRSHVEKLDLSDNRLHHLTCKVLRRVVRVNRYLKNLNCKWNSFGNKGVEILMQYFGENKRLKSVNLSSNAIGLDGGLAIVNGLLSNRTLTCLDISCNFLPTPFSYVCADLLLLNKSIQVLALGQNPIAASGLELLHHVCRMKLHPINLQTSADNLELPFITSSSPSMQYQACVYDCENPHGHYELDLGVKWDYTIFHLLRMRFKRKWGHLQNVLINGHTINTDYGLPVNDTGLVLCDFLPRTEAEMESIAAPIGFKFDFSVLNHQKLIEILIERAMFEPAEYWRKSYWDGQVFEFKEDMNMIESLLHCKTGSLELEFYSTEVKCFQQYSLHLKNKADRQILSELFDRQYRGYVHETKFGWSEMHYDAKESSLEAFTLIPISKATSSQMAFTIPSTGILDFSYSIPRPVHVLSQRLSLDLAYSVEYTHAQNLSYYAATGAKTSWWNVTINDYPCTWVKSPDFCFPRKGQLKFQLGCFGTAYEVERSEIKRFEFNLSHGMSYAAAEILRLMMLQNRQQYVWMNVKIENSPLTQLNEILPAKGRLRFDFISFCLDDQLSDANHQALVEKLDEKGLSRNQKYKILNFKPRGSIRRESLSLSSPSTPGGRRRRRNSLVMANQVKVQYTSAMVLEYLDRFIQVNDKQHLLDNIYSQVIDKHNLVQLGVKIRSQECARFVHLKSLEEIYQQYQSMFDSPSF